MDKLAEIMAHKRREIEPRLRPVRERDLARFAEVKRPGPSFAQALDQPGRLGVIAEIKRRSPSAGDIKAGADAVEQARRYTNAGADCISVLTDEKYFGGSLRDLWDVVEFEVTTGRHVPCLRKDFMVHPLQIIEAAEAGARAILIIVRALKDEEIKILHDSAQLAGLDSLFEIHEERELERALRHGARLIGVNNRDLTTVQFTTNLAISEKLLPLIPASALAVSESGIHTPEDAARVRAAGAGAILVGEALMKAEDPEKLLKELSEAQG
jgi:indole-3-glycerol phosphate synthase